MLKLGIDYIALYNQEKARADNLENFFKKLVDYDRQSLLNEIELLKVKLNDIETVNNKLMAEKGRLSKKANTQYKNSIDWYDTQINKTKNMLYKSERDVKRLEYELINKEQVITGLMAQVEELKQTRELLDTIDNNIDTLIDICINNFDEIKQMLINEFTKDEIMEAIENAEVNLKQRMTTEESKQRDIDMAKGLAEGLTQREVANKYMNIKNRESALSKKMKSENFKLLIEYFKGNINDAPNYYKQALKNS